MTKIHDLQNLTHEEAYDHTQTGTVKSGDFLLVAGGVAVMLGAWPTMIDGASDVLHMFDTDGQDERQGHRDRYKALVAGKDLEPAYEVSNPSFRDMSLAQQIAAGICDWCAEDADGREFFGTTKDAAEAARTAHSPGEPTASWATQEELMTAIDQWGCDDIKFDDEARVSRAADGAVWVQGWVRVGV